MKLWDRRNKLSGETMEDIMILYEFHLLTLGEVLEDLGGAYEEADDDDDDEDKREETRFWIFV